MSRIKEDYRSLTGPQKAAIMMLSLGEDHSAKLFAMMDDEEIRELSQIMANLGTIGSTLVERLFVDFADAISNTGSLVGSYDTTERLLMRSLPKDRVDLIMEEIRGPAGRTMWDKLGNVNEQVLANYLKNEYPQTVAVVLSKIKPDHASRVLSLLPENFAMEVIMRMLHMEAVQKEVLDGVEKTLRTEFMSNLARTAKRDAHEMMAEIFNNLDRNTESRFITALEERSRESAEKIKQLMFTFEDLKRLDAQGVQTLLRHVEKDKLGLALKGASDPVKEMFFGNMSERAGKMLREDMEAMGPVRLREVDEAQNSIVTLAKELSNSGQIVISEGKEDDELVY
ncbi:flagellar motor switch protein FliG [Rhodospirillum rubrum]|uniref:Flagellar motor switch protein FliG n=1 Tax=Rhodospirillum rubrum (strain ATCC 11170 / ATH 1.1.1 / DSM 467 / LMG 4362 / NCIMB 8255 / S1) TaxID=269796 RepID=Q2RWZ7_RHORT|nr:flagellar motor switch protein FliG [Rhodospirillum rubrum]ABC21348.1 Flagellar motor switch protein FliG [Rhodospirillum rubrum ATCC 11170]AEO47028.1 flagellar motor switch protein G [Rhodospirillum rubrum F11]MBK1665445.1 flagellar motor switch protein FliG [Rhodospirillum rubrum]MBK1677360.1 flagellar motor switch protein FliG [Rhodospirillum rubrum]MBK5952934.1 flagellar motor switch protein FliG [Rhodospirillum rubrum]